MTKILIACLISLLIICAGLIVYIKYRTIVVGYTMPQIERYADGTTDVISYPIYLPQAASSAHLKP